MLIPSFVNLLHLDDEDIDPETPGNINFDLEYVRMVFFIALHSDTFFDGEIQLLLSFMTSRVLIQLL